jgi:uncharacterized Zn finger protein (UPF0148 family)
MYCPKCGNELTSDNVFCPKCGTKIASDLATSHENAPISKNFENVDVQNAFTQRVNSELFDDRRSQNMLFSLYAKLVKPVKEIEAITEKIENLQQKILELRDVKSINDRFFSRIIIIVFIAVLVIQFFPGTLAGSFYDGVVGPYIFVPVTDFLMEHLWQLIAILLGVVFWLITLLFTPIVFTIPAIFVANFLSSLYVKAKYKSNLKMAEELELELNQFFSERTSMCNAIKNEIAYVPKAYRYSHALRYFAEMYEQQRVDTLKEAVNCYVNDKHQAKLLNTIEANVNKVLEYLAFIAEMTI